MTSLNASNLASGTVPLSVLPQATTGTSGYLSSTDWNTFNSGVNLDNIATSANVASRVVKRDPSGNFSAGSISATSASASKAGLIVQGVASQTAHLLDVKNSSGTILFDVNSAGNVGIGTTSPTAKLTVSGISGTDGIQFPDGSLQTSAINANHLLFYTSSGTFTVPSGVTRVKATLMGGGGGGFSVSSCPTSGGGGGSGGYCEGYVSVTPGANMSYTVGTGGTANTAGGSSTFGSLTANGGGAGANNSAGSGGSTSGCTVGITGFTGQSNFWIGIGNGGFAGGNSPKKWGKGGTCQIETLASPLGNNGQSAQGYGAGGGGANCQGSASPTFTGGAGAPGFVQLEY
jgi:hypothetical protein